MRERVRAAPDPGRDGTSGVVERPGAVELVLNAELTGQVLTRFIYEEVTKVGLERVVIGLSGGIDSALAAGALGARNVTALVMPHRTSSPDSQRHATAVAEQFNLEVRTIEITPVIDACFRLHEPEADAVRRGSKMARERMAILHDHSAKLRAPVLGTSNKAELLLGYGTLHGDMASAVNPPRRPRQDAGPAARTAPVPPRGDHREEAVSRPVARPVRRGGAGVYLR